MSHQCWRKQCPQPLQHPSQRKSAWRRSKAARTFEPRFSKRLKKRGFLLERRNCPRFPHPPLHREAARRRPRAAPAPQAPGVPEAPGREADGWSRGAAGGGVWLELRFVLEHRGAAPRLWEPGIFFCKNKCLYGIWFLLGGPFRIFFSQLND